MYVPSFPSEFTFSFVGMYNKCIKQKILEDAKCIFSDLK